MKMNVRISLRYSLLAIAMLGLLLPPWRGNNVFDKEVEAAQFLPSAAVEGTVFAVTAGNNLISFNQFAPGAIIKTTLISGLATGESITGIDFRPKTGQLYAVSNQSRVFIINTATAAASQVGTMAFTPAAAGTSFGFDFNPVPDRIRFVSDADQDLRLNPDTGAVAGTDTNLAFATGDANAGQNPNVVGSAYTNNFSGSTITTLYGIDSSLDVLVTQGSIGGAPISPNTGQLLTVGALGVNTTDQVGFDIVNPSGLALASLTPMGQTTSSLYSINLMTGAAMLIGPIGGTEIIRDIAVVMPVETIFAINAQNVLLAFNSGTPNTVVLTRPVTGLAMGEVIQGIDFRPATGILYGVSSASRLYTINTSTGAASLVGSGALSTALAGAAFGFDFNPVPDRIRLTSDQDQNLRLNPNNGAVAGTDTNLVYASGDANAAMNPNIVASAYTNNFAGTTTTTLYGIDSLQDALALQGSIGGTPTSPNTGQLTTVGKLGVDVTPDVGFDIAPRTGAAFASLTTAGQTASSSLYTINLTSGVATLVGSIGGAATIKDIAIAPRVETTFALTASNKLLTFAATAPSVILNTATITGIGAGEQILGIDFRPANMMLYALSSASRIYVINPVTGAASPVGMTPFTPALNGMSFGFDFNPVPDRIRLVSNATQDLRLNPDTGAVAGTDGMLAYAAGDPRAGQAPNVVAAAYNNNFAGTTSTTLYVIDSMSDSLALQGSPGGAPTSPNTGTLFTVGSLGVDTSDQIGFDIADETNNAFASLTVGGTPQFYSINLQSGAATLIGNIGGGEQITDISVGNVVPASAQFGGAASTNAASFVQDFFAPGSLIALFGRFQTMNGQVAVATTTPLPITLGGLGVKVNGMDAGLLVASNGQINLALPQSLNDGMATVVVTNSDMTVRTGMINIQRAATGIFTFLANGGGTPAAVATTDGINFIAAFNNDGSPRPLSAGSAGAPNVLVLFVTGLRNVPASNPMDTNGVAEAVNVSFTTASGASTNGVVMFGGPAPGLLGVDQINVVIPPSLAGAGLVNIKVSTPGVNNYTSNTVSIRVQ